MVQDPPSLEILASVSEMEPNMVQQEGSSSKQRNPFKYFFDIIYWEDSREWINIRIHKVAIQKHWDDEFIVNKKRVEVSVALRAKQVPKVIPIHREEVFTQRELAIFWFAFYIYKRPLEVLKNQCLDEHAFIKVVDPMKDVDE